MLLKIKIISKISRYSEFQIVGAAWQKAQSAENSPGPSIVK